VSLNLDDTGGKVMKAIAAVIGALAVAFGLGGTAVAAPLHSAGTNAMRAHHRHHRRHRHHGIPQHNGGDHDSDNNGGPSDGDRNL
jgi:hypothetical protein